MFVRLTRAKRSRAGWLLALVYMLCVLAPGISFAFSDGSRAATCLTAEIRGIDIVYVHELSETSAQNARKAGQVHEHSANLAHSGPSQGHHEAMTYVADKAPATTDGPHNAGTQCCGMLCLSALPATIIDIAKPDAPPSVCVSENYRNVADNAPPGLYRPPIT